MDIDSFLKHRLFLKNMSGNGGDLRMLHGIGSTEVVVVGLILLVMFGGKKLPELSRGIGDSIREFRKAAKEVA